MRLRATQLDVTGAGGRLFGSSGALDDPLWILAGARPLLDLPFARNRSLTDVISGQDLITFGRVGNGTYVDSDRILKTGGTNVPLFDHDPVTGESLGLLLQGQYQNKLLRSEDFATTWAATNSSIGTNQATAPDNNTTADKLVCGTGTPIFQGVTQSSTATTTAGDRFSVYAKAAELSQLELRSFNPPSDIALFDLITQQATSQSASPDPVITDAGNGWYNCSIGGNNSDATSFRISLVSAGNRTFTPIPGAGIFLWGAALAPTGSSYIPTTDSAVTRNADFADLIDAAIANNIRTLFLEFRSPASGTRGVVSLNDNTANERAAVITSGTDPRLVVHDGGVEQANIDGGTVTANQRTRVAVRINANDFAISINGGTVVADTSGTLPTVDRLMLGRTQAGDYLNGPLARVIGWQQLLPDSTLQELSR
jgi:hypothetical protein